VLFVCSRFLSTGSSLTCECTSSSLPATRYASLFSTKVWRGLRQPSMLHQHRVMWYVISHLHVCPSVVKTDPTLTCLSDVICGFYCGLNSVVSQVHWGLAAEEKHETVRKQCVEIIAGREMCQLAGRTMTVNLRKKTMHIFVQLYAARLSSIDSLNL